MPKLTKIPHEAVSDYITQHKTFHLLWTAAQTADFCAVQTVSLFGLIDTSDRLSVTAWALMQGIALRARG